MNEIDWSKAPEGADFHFQPKTKGAVGGFYGIASTHDRFVSQSGSYILFNDMSSVADLFVVNSRPGSVPAWDGEGLPPVGAICEYRPLGSNERHRVEILLHIDAGVARAAVFFKPGTREVTQAINVCFHPIRTPEQIAEDDRTKAINEMESRAKSYGIWDVCADLYDAGYRKTDVQ